MNTKILAGMVVLIALVLASTGIVFAKTEVVSNVQVLQGPDGQEGPLHDFMLQALAKALGIDAEELDARIEKGERPYQIALELGFSEDEIPALIHAAREEALTNAVAAGVITQQQADWMISRGNRAGRGMGQCETGMHNFQRQGGWRWQSTNP